MLSPNQPCKLLHQNRTTPGTHDDTNTGYRNGTGAEKMLETRGRSRKNAYLVKRDAFSGSPGLRGGEGNTQDSVGSHVGLVVGAVFLDHSLKATLQRDSSVGWETGTGEMGTEISAGGRRVTSNGSVS